MIDKPGRYENVSFADYLADPCPEPALSRSVIKDLLRCPAKAFYNHPRLNPGGCEKKESEKFDIGTAAHALFLQGMNVAVVVDFDDWRTKEAKLARHEAREAGKVPLLTSQFCSVNNMVGIAHATLLDEMGLEIKDGTPEVTYIWQEEKTWIKTRLDWQGRQKQLIIDYKTTEDASPTGFNRIAASTGLDIQQSLYTRGVIAVDGIIPEFIFMVQEVDPPHICQFYQLDPMFSDMGEGKVNQGITIWRECMETGKWPGYSSGINRLEPPPFALAAWESKRFTFEVERKDEYGGL